MFLPTGVPKLVNGCFCQKLLANSLTDVFLRGIVKFVNVCRLLVLLTVIGCSRVQSHGFTKRYPKLSCRVQSTGFFLKGITNLVVGCSRLVFRKGITNLVVGCSRLVFLKGITNLVVGCSRLVFVKGIRKFVNRCSRPVFSKRYCKLSCRVQSIGFSKRYYNFSCRVQFLVFEKGV